MSKRWIRCKGTIVVPLQRTEQHILFVRILGPKERISGSKKRESILAFVSNDFFRQIMNVFVGWPGSIHDSRIRNNTCVIRATEDPIMFCIHDNSLRYASFMQSHRFVPPYKLPLYAFAEHKFHSCCHFSLPKSSNHTIGLEKNRIQVII